jgi:hypothetical protein
MQAAQGGSTREQKRALGGGPAAGWAGNALPRAAWRGAAVSGAWAASPALGRAGQRRPRAPAISNTGRGRAETGASGIWGVKKAALAAQTAARTARSGWPALCGWGDGAGGTGGGRRGRAAMGGACWGAHTGKAGDGFGSAGAAVPHSIAHNGREHGSALRLARAQAARRGAAQHSARPRSRPPARGRAGNTDWKKHCFRAPTPVAVLEPVPRRGAVLLVFMVVF